MYIVYIYLVLANPTWPTLLVQPYIYIYMHGSDPWSTLLGQPYLYIYMVLTLGQPYLANPIYMYLYLYIYIYIRRVLANPRSKSPTSSARTNDMSCQQQALAHTLLIRHTGLSTRTNGMSCQQQALAHALLVRHTGLSARTNNMSCLQRALLPRSCW